MEFFDSLFSGGPENAGDIHEAFMQGQKEAHDIARRLIDLAKPYVDKGQPMEGSVMIFTAILRAVGLIKAGVYKSVEQHGEGSPVKKTWDILEEALTAKDVDAAMGDILRREMDNE